MLTNTVRKSSRRLVSLLGCAVLTSAAIAQTSSLVSVGPDGRLVYTANSRGDVVPDFSGVGYKNSEAEIPTVPVRREVTPVSGDDRTNIQNAINYVAGLPVQPDGFRGAVLIRAGTYEVGAKINITASGVVIRGEGFGTGGTNIIATATSQYDLIHFNGSGGVSVDASTRSRISGSYVPIGAKTVNVQSGHSFAVGDAVNLEYIPNQAWIDLIGMEDYWSPGSYDYSSERRVVAVSGNAITLDAPVMAAIDSRYAVGNLVKISGDDRMQNVGIENLRLTSRYSSSTDENHGWSAVVFDDVKNGWARDIEAYYFGYSCVNIASDSNFWITVDNCKMIDPKSQVQGGRRYSFPINGQRCLVMNCVSRNGGRHDYVSGSLTAGPSVFYNCRAENVSPNHDSGPHHRWTVGHLYDRVVTDQLLNCQNRLASGTGHGWAGAQNMFWNCTSLKTILQNPAGPHINWAIGHTGQITNVGQYTTEPLGVVQSQGTKIAAIPSLFLAQLNDRLGPPALPAASTPTFSPPGGSYTGTASVTITSSAGATIRYTTDGNDPSPTVGTIYTGPVTVSSSLTLKAIAYDGGFSPSSISTANYVIGSGGGGGTTVTAAQGFYNTPLPSSQSGTFTATFDATLTGSDATVALSSGAQTGYAGLAAIVRFNTAGTIDARNGGAYAAASSIPYSSGVTYRVRLVVNVSTRTYSAYVTPAGGAEQTIGTNYAFRTEQAGVTSLDTFNVDINTGSINVSAVTISSGTPVGVTFYQNTNYGGDASQLLPKGNYTLAQLAAAGVPNDWASSVKIPAGWTVIIYSSDNFSGTSWTRTADTPSFSSLSPTANDVMSSCRIQ